MVHSQVPVLIRGESGTGKALVARALHEQGLHPALPFLAVNSAALPDSLLESELFGYRKGAFTGADRDREGVFAEARGGTVFLDEIALMPLSFQGKLLRVLQERTVTPLGSAVSRPVAFRLVVATNRSLRERMAEGTFRDDLYYRICVATIERVSALLERLVKGVSARALSRCMRRLIRRPSQRGRAAEERCSRGQSTSRSVGRRYTLPHVLQRAVVKSPPRET